MKKRSELAQQLLLHLRKEEGVRPGERIAIGVSGGADSVALLRLLLEIREILGVTLSVAHFNHLLRGRASHADEKFVAQLAKRHGLEFFSASESVAKRARREKANLEDAGRRARYSFFEGLAREQKLNRIAIAHTADDQAETVLAHILRGTGIAGLGGIHPQVGVIFRPLLQFRREELRRYVRRLKQPWREDATNRDTTRTRARIRSKLLPLLQKQFQPAIVENLCRLADLAREDSLYFEQQVRQLAASSFERSAAGVRIHLHVLKEDESARAEIVIPRRALTSRLLRHLLAELKPAAGQISATHIASILYLCHRGQAGKSIQVPGGLEVCREPDSLLIRPIQKSLQLAANAYEFPVDPATGECVWRLPQQPYFLRFSVIDWPRKGRETSELEVVLDLERLGSGLLLRNWRPGDAFQPQGHKKPHALARLLNEKRISRWAKAGWPVLTSGETVVWVRGFSPAAAFAPAERTRKALVITSGTNS